jgi:hypothetical protein
LIGFVQLEKLASGMGHAADFDDASREQGFVAGIVIDCWR